MADRTGRVREWIGRYLAAEISGLVGALTAALAMITWAPDRLALAAYASSLGETIGFYAGYLVTRYRREDIDGPPRRRIVIILAAAVVEFGPAEVLDTLVLRPAAMFLGSWVTGNVFAGVLIGKVVADLIFYGLAITSYEVLVRRLLQRLRRSGPTLDHIEVAVTTADDVVLAAPASPELVMDLDVVDRCFRRFSAALPGVEIHFATKCNPDPPLLSHLHALGARFEVASVPELDTLISLGVEPAEVIFSNPVKPWWHIRDAHAAGVRIFAADSDSELAKLAEHAAGADVMIRMAVSPAASDVPSEGKFGVDVDEAVRLVLAAADAGLRPWGLTFHVGSQMTDPSAWVAPIRQAAVIMDRLTAAGIQLAAVDLGGGFPADYGHPVPSIETYGATIRAALTSLPYEVRLLAEPGRGLVADAGRLHATVIGVARRLGRRWAHLDIGAFNGVMEALETGRRLVLPITASRGGPTVSWTVTGPSCDSQDTVNDSAALPASLQVGDQVVLRTAGAYTTAYASTFNGFAVPSIRYERGATAVPRAASSLLAAGSTV